MHSVFGCGRDLPSCSALLRLQRVSIVVHIHDFLIREKFRYRLRLRKRQSRVQRTMKSASLSMASMSRLAMWRMMAFRATTFRHSKITTAQECFFYRMFMVTKAAESEISCTDWPALVTSTNLSPTFFCSELLCSFSLKLASHSLRAKS